MTHKIELNEGQRQLTLLALAVLSLQNPGFDSALAEIALLMDNPTGADRRPEMFEAFKRYRSSDKDCPRLATPVPNLGGLGVSDIFYAAGALKSMAVRQPSRAPDDHDILILEAASLALLGAGKRLMIIPEMIKRRQICSPENPMPKGAPGIWEHTNAEEVGDQRPGYPGGDLITMRCKDCGHKWTEELPQ